MKSKFIYTSISAPVTTDACALHTITKVMEFKNPKGDKCKTLKPVTLGVCMGKCRSEQVMYSYSKPDI